MASNTVPKSIKASLYIDGKPAENSIKNLAQIARTLERELNQLTIGTEAWTRKMEELQRVRGHLQGVKNDVKGIGGAFGQLREELGKVGTLAAGYLGFQFITGQFQNIISSNAKLSDSLADLRRVTGLTEAGVLNLDASLGKLDTRTSKSGLRDIAIIAGKLGVAKTQILGFVEATDKLVVALGDELGNADQITTTLGKILNVFDGEVTGDNITRLGNAMVKLANDGVASAGFISDFTQRVSGIAKTAGLSLPATIAFGAGIEELGGRSESAATAMQKLLLSISSDTPKAAKIAGVSVKEFSKLLGDAPEQALLKYTRGLVANKNAFSEVTKSLDDAGEEGARTIETITKLGQNFDFFSGKIKDATIAIGEYGDINEAFNLKNQTLGGQLDKLGKDFNSLSSNKGLVNLFTSLVYTASQAVNWIKRNSEAIATFFKVLLIAATAWGTYRAYVFLANSALASFIINLVRGETVIALSRTSTLALAAAKAILAGNFAKASQAMRLLNATMAANPIGLVLSAVLAVTAAIALFSSTASNAARIQTELNDVKAKGLSKMVEERSTIQTFVAALKNENVTREQKNAIVKKLREMMPAHLKGYTDEEIKAGKAEEAIKRYVAALEKRSLAEAAQERIRELQKENIELGSADGSKASGFWGGANETFQAIYGAIGMDGQVQRLRNNVKASNTEKIKANKAAINEIKNLYGGDMLNNALSEPEVTTGGGYVKPDKKAESAAKKAWKEALAEYQKLGEEWKKLNLDRLNDQLSANEKEVKQEEDKYNALIAKERAFLNMKGATPAQKKQTEANIASIGTDRDKAVAALRLRQETELFQQISELRIKLTDLHETELQKQTDQINKFYDDLVRKNKGNAAIIEQINADRATELGNAAVRETERLAKEKAEIEAKYETVSGTKPENRLAVINKQYDDEIKALKAKFSAQLIATKEFEDAVAAIERNRAAETARLEIEKKIKTNETLITGTKAFADTTFSLLESNRNAETNSVIRSLENQRQAELENKNLTDQQKEAINKKYDDRVRAEKKKAFEAEKQAAIAQALINGFLAMTKVSAQTGILSFAFAPAVAIATAAQVALIAAQPTPEFADGGFSNEDPAGYVGRPTVFKKSASGRPFMAGEAGKEWIAPNWMVTNPRYANVIGMLESARQEKRAYASGGFNSVSESNKMPTTPKTDQDPNSELRSLVMLFIQEQQRFNSLPIINDYAKKEEYERQLQNDRDLQKG